MLPFFAYENHMNERINVAKICDNLWEIIHRGGNNPKLSMTNAFDVIDRINGKMRGNGTIICMYESVQWLNERTVAIPVEYM